LNLEEKGTRGAMKDIFERLLAAKIDWLEPPSSLYFQATFEGKNVRLRINDFPEEIMCTMFVDNEEQNWDQFPPNWILPRHRGEEI
jgi:hypothetical protein